MLTLQGGGSKLKAKQTRDGDRTFKKKRIFAKKRRIMKKFLSLIPLALLLSCGTSNNLVDILAEHRTHNLGYGIVVTDGSKTESVTTVEMSELAPYRTIYEFLAGRVAGVMVQGEKVTIRGINSINASTDPLFIVNGTAVTDISWLNPRDVKTVDVLKDGAACSLYGSRGANGVIIITTK